jgi:uncharacterized membrane protein YoaK (UPF0700 family)
METMSERSVDGPMNRRVQPAKSSTTNIGIAFLAVASGSLDVIVFLTLGGVFASAMTGNTALLGIAISDGDWVSAARPAIALIGFMIGTATASVASHPNATMARQSATLRGLVLFEASCLVVFAMIRQLSVDLTPNMLILLCSFSMGIQGIAAKMVGSPGVNTIVFTSTVVEIASSVTNILLGRQDRPQARSDTIRQILGFAAYGAGALIAGLLAWSKFFLLAWLPVTAVLLAFACFEAARERRKVA